MLSWACNVTCKAAGWHHCTEGGNACQSCTEHVHSGQQIGKLGLFLRFATRRVFAYVTPSGSEMYASFKMTF